MTSFTRMNWTGVEPLASPSSASAQRVAAANFVCSDLDYEALRRERAAARWIANLKWLCVGSCISWVGFILLSL